MALELFIKIIILYIFFFIIHYALLGRKMANSVKSLRSIVKGLKTKEDRIATQASGLEVIKLHYGYFNYKIWSVILVLYYPFYYFIFKEK